MKTRIAIAVVLLVVPLALFWYGATRCSELSCIGPSADAVMDAIVVAPLLLLWLIRRRPTPLAMLVFAEAAMAYTTLRRDFDFSPQFRLIGIAFGLTVGAVLGTAVARR